MPNIEEITKYQPKTLTKIYDRNDFLQGLFFDEKREYRKINKIPLMIRNAFISAEDKNFFKHNGYDPIGYLKAIISFIKEGKLRGASTITQQITKGFLLSGERTFERKIKELILALRLEDALPKNKILEIYLNEVYLGENSYGIVAASKTYFSKDLDELTPGEAAFLAALPKSPKQYNPKNNISNAVNRRNFVLKEMYQNGYLDKKSRDTEIKKDLITNLNKISTVHQNYKLLEGFLADEIRSDIQNLLGSGFLSKGGLRITTSLNVNLQKKSKDLLIRELIDLDIKNNDFKPTIFNSNIKNYDKNDWENFYRDNIQKINDNIWNLGVVAINKDGKYLLKTEKSNTLLNLNIPHEKPPVFANGDVVYFKVDKDKRKLIYKQIPFFDGGIIIYDRKLDDILVLNGGFNYLSSNLNMVTERKENFKQALVPFLRFIMLDQNLLFKPNVDFLSILNKNKKLLNDIDADSIKDNSNVIKINKKYISELGLNYLSSTK
ncbi:MAG: transglycosylase domain-containing protein, partial [Paracoccaceae bacterium]